MSEVDRKIRACANQWAGFEPVILCYQNGRKMVTVLGRQDSSWGPEFFALLICDIARHVARAFDVAENYVWDRIDMERVNPTANIETFRPQ